MQQGRHSGRSLLRECYGGQDYACTKAPMLYANSSVLTFDSHAR